LGRTDFQVKLRGFRIELGEIEAVLSSEAGVRHALVLLREDVPGNPRLVAYVVPAPGGTLAAEALRAALEQRLPGHMVPSAFVVLEALPLTPNGKVDRKALPVPDAATASAGYVAPRTPTEETLAELFAAVLRLPRVSATGHFFELGGHSLLAMQLVSRVRSTLGVELPLRTLFEAPTVAALATRLDGLRFQEHALQAPPLVARTTASHALPLSFAQQRLWFLEQLQPGPAYNMPSPVRLTGALDVAALERALEALIQRHESLRTTFASHQGEPVQVIHPVSTFRLPVVELGSLPAGQREAEAHRLATDDAGRPFDLSEGPLFRASLLKLAPEDHVLLLTMHHIVSDGWSMGILIRELTSLYESFATGGTPQLPPLPVQYADFALWQRDWLRGDVLEAQLGYWKQQLGGAPQALELPGDRPRPPVQTFAGALLPFALPAGLSQRLETLAREHDATLFMVLLAAFQTLLHRYSGQDDLVVGSPTAGRNRTETEGLIGFFVNSLALRARFSDADTFTSLLAQVRETTLGAYAHQDVPFEKLVEALQYERDLSRSPVFQVMFAVQNLPDAEVSLPGLTLSPLGTGDSSAKFDLSLSLQPGAGGLTGSLSYNTDLFDAATMTRLVEHLGVLLESAVENPRQRLSELPLMRAAEQHRLLVEWNDTRTTLRRSLIHHLVSAQVARTPDATALVVGEERLTYRQLDERANQLAWHLLSLGVVPETRVAICMERSTELVVSLLAVLKAGGAYVPLDPAYPRGRLDYTLSDSGARLLLSHQSLLDSLQLDTGGLRTVCLDALPEFFSRLPTSTPAHQASEDNLAYVIYTSGSTGRPKGVAISHASATAFLDWSTRTFSADQLAGTLAATSICFDLSIFELFAPLASGGTVLLAANALALASLPAAREVTLVNTVPSAVAELLRMGAIPPSVTTVNLAGEPLPGALVRGLYTTGTVRHVFNLYGPTEDTTYSTYTRVPEGPGEPTIGVPLPETSGYILNARFQLQPVGIPGELYLAGAGLARGYLGRPDLTAERFMPDLFSPAPGARMYRTGDLVRRLADGQLEYLGRIDHQVKVRGFRIELGEIEAGLRQHADVGGAVVMARQDGPAGDKRLVAYVVAVEGRTLEVDALRRHLGQHVPDFMVPSAFVVLPALPLTPNGKVDRKALPAPDVSTASAGYVAPRTPTEELLAAIWAQVLGLEKVGAEDHFFALGGHSLLATQVISRVRSTFGVELPLRAVFEAPTVASLAARIDEARKQARQGSEPLPLGPVLRTGLVPLSFAQQRLWFIDQLEPGSVAYNLPTFVRLQGPLDTGALRRALVELVRRHEALRTTFVEQEGQPFQRIAPSAELPLELVDLSGLAPEAAHEALQARLREEALRPFDLATGPLLRVGLWRLRQDSHVLALDMHHIVSDGWSMGVLVREVTALYEAFVKGQPSPLPPLPLQYPDYAVWQREWLQGAVLEEQLGWWRQQLSGLSHLELPTDRPRPPVQTFRGAHTGVALSRATSDALRALCQQEGATPFMALLAAFQVLLSRYSGQQDISVGSPIAGRQRGELEGLIGFFVNTLVLRARVESQASFVHLLRQVKETALGAYAHQDVPFERLVEELQSRRDLGRSPLFQVFFALQNTSTGPVREGLLELHPVAVEGGSATAKFEVQLDLSESPDGYHGTLGYNTDLFEAATAERMAAHFGLLVEALVARPEAPLASVSMLTAEERRRVLVEWNATATEYPRGSTLPEVFAGVVARYPEKVAVEFASELGSQKLTYRQLDARANQLAHHLRALGVSTDSRVALAVDRSLELIVSLVAILKAGAAYVPLDPSYPRERLAAMMEDSRPRVLVTTRALLPTLPTRSVVTLVLEDNDPSQQPDTALPPAALPDSLAYIDFTSGSTGRPKGVGTTQSAVLRTVFGVDYAHLGPDETFLLIAPVSFDASTLELWAPLLHGGRLVVFPPHSPSDVHELERVLVRHGVTTLHLTSGLFTQVVDNHLAALRGVRQLLTGGDVVSAPHVRRVLEALKIPVTACYGPTETTLFASCHRMTDVAHVGTAVPIGRPIGNTRVYVLDAAGQPVPAGIVGELFIGGDGVARGYVEQPALTAERFIPDALSGLPGARLYRTGDLARWRNDGVLEFVGRADAQVKVRGYRIELAEVEAALLAHADVREAVVLAREDVPGTKRLVGYVVAPDSLDTAALRAFLQERLPEYMVPSALVRLD
ncbi:amino acid adenylation domain-containing protein, partial [Pyxidicoccus sp. 3LG]